MLDLRQIALREERRNGLGVSEIADASIPIGGGIASRGPAKTWVNVACGIGLDGPVERSEIDRLVAFYAEAAVEPRVEVCPLAHPSFMSGLHAAGFRPHGFESVLVRALAAGETFAPQEAPPAGLEIRLVDPADAGESLAHARAVTAAFACDDEGVAKPVREVELELMLRCVRHRRTTCLSALVDDVVVGGGSIEFLDDLAALYASSVLPEFRRRGVQQALVAARLALAVQRGAALATISGTPGAVTERNARRFGFQVAYTKVAFVGGT